MDSRSLFIFCIDHGVLCTMFFFKNIPDKKLVKRKKDLEINNNECKVISKSEA